MSLDKKQKEAIFIDLLINTFSNNPLLYDKSESTYVYTPEKIKLLKQLSDYLKNKFDITKGVTEIIAAWQKLVSQFKKADEKQSSGSAASTNDFEYYNDLLFLKPTLNHKSKVTSSMMSRSSSASSLITIPSTTVQTTTSTSSISQAATTITPSTAIQNATLTNAWQYAASSSGNVSDCFGSPINLPHVLPCALPGVAGQYPPWPTMSPYAFASTVPYPYYPFSQVLPGVSSQWPNQYMPLMPMNSATLSVNAPQMSPAVLAPINNNAVAPLSTQKNNTVSKQCATSSAKVPEYDSFAKKKLKCMNEDEHRFKEISDSIVCTLDKLDQKLVAPQSSASSSSLASASANVSTFSNSCNQSPEALSSASPEYFNLLYTALSKVPMDMQDELMEYILHELVKFNGQFESI